MFENLQERFERAFKVLKGHGSITEVNVGDTLKEVRKALLDADVDFKTAKNFIRMRGAGACVLWRIRIDPIQKCKHVNLVTRRVEGLPDEQEYLFAPYSVFTVLSANWNVGSIEEPHEIELLAASDNCGPSEDLPLAPWA